MEDHQKMIGGGLGGISLSAFFKLFHEMAGMASDLAAYGGLFLVIMGIIAWWRNRKK